MCKRFAGSSLVASLVATLGEACHTFAGHVVAFVWNCFDFLHWMDIQTPHTVYRVRCFGLESIFSNRPHSPRKKEMSLSHTRMHPNQGGGVWTVLVFQQQKERESFCSLSVSLSFSFVHFVVSFLFCFARFYCLISQRTRGGRHGSQLNDLELQGLLQGRCGYDITLGLPHSNHQCTTTSAVVVVRCSNSSSSCSSSGWGWGWWWLIEIAFGRCGRTH